MLVLLDLEPGKYLLVFSLQRLEVYSSRLGFDLYRQNVFLVYVVMLLLVIQWVLWLDKNKITSK